MNSRHHHYIPQCYLRGFVDEVGSKGRLIVASLKDRRRFETKPRNVAGIRYFNRIDAEGVKSDVLETILSDFEGKVATALRHIDETGVFEGNDRLTILNLVALLAVRHPTMRENWRRFEEECARRILDLTLATKECYDSSVQQVKNDGIEVPEDVSYEDLKVAHESGDYTLEVPRERHLDLEFRSMDTVLSLLVERKWSLFRSREPESPFITTDRPVVLTWRHPEKLPAPMRHSPGFQMLDTEVLFPLSKRAVIAGTFDQPEVAVDVSLPLVAMANTKMIMHAVDQLYSSTSRFPYFGQDGQAYNDCLLFQRVGT
jgi:hypothetical protein